ncbi:RimK family alpha-L-glutamate ligase [Brachybacterium sp. YJGR34]|uniref:ATP-grasp domain-containing protein n=1 Tax=Brachybacterium sp. YJGR34 TaxID=2059911 RepID=UPI000E0A4215|nr:hypothetical protein [Brachybacterium sp. YJGR34]
MIDVAHTRRPLLLVLADARDDEDFALLFPALREHGVDAVRCDPRDLVTRIEDGRLRFSIPGGDVEPALVLGWVLEELLVPGMVALELFVEAGISVVNDAATLFRAENKLLDSARLAAAGAAHHGVLSARDPADLLAWMERGHADVVVKPLSGYGGEGIAHIDGEKTRRRWLDSREETQEPYLVMPYVETGGRDIRVYTINHHPVFAMYRYAPEDSFVTNVLAGGSIAMCPLTAELSDLAARASRAAGTLIGGIDIGEEASTGDLIVFEVNSCPSLEPAVIDDVASFLAATVHDRADALRTWTPSHVHRERDDDPALFHESKRGLIRNLR